MYCCFVVDCCLPFFIGVAVVAAVDDAVVGTNKKSITKSTNMYVQDNKTIVPCVMLLFVVFA